MAMIMQTASEVRLIRVLIIHNDDPLLAGVERLLGQEEDLDTIQILPTDPSGIAKEIERLHPQVVITGEKTLWAGSQEMFDLFSMYPKLRVVVVNNSNNLLQMYTKEEILIEKLDDFISKVKG